jgi:hypothetical protein
VLRHSCRWKIGDDSKINVMTEPWFKKKDGLWMPSPQDQGVSSLIVNNLMSSRGKWWDRHKINSLFLSDMEEDKLVWNDDLHNNCNVKCNTNCCWKMT